MNLSNFSDFFNSSSNFTSTHAHSPNPNVHHQHGCSGSPWYSFWIGGIATTCLCSFAIFGNFIGMLVLSRRSMRSSVNCILLALSCSDFIHVTSCLLIRGIHRTLQHFCTGHSYTDIFQPLAFPYLFPIGTIAQVTSVYFTVLVSIERYIAVCKPFRARIWCTWGRSAIFCVVVFLFSFSYNLPTWWELETHERKKIIGNVTTVRYVARKTDLYSHPNYVFYYVNWGSFFVIRLVPFTVLIILNTLIYKQILVMNRRRLDMSSSQIQEVSIAKMLFCIVIIFLLCNVVTIISHMMEAFGGPRPNELTAASNFLVLMNSATNFIIYCLLSRKFRVVLLTLARNNSPSWCVSWIANDANNHNHTRNPNQTEVFTLASNSKSTSH